MDRTAQALRQATLYPPKANQEAVLRGLSRILRQADYGRLVIAGGPRAGKTTLAASIARDGVRVRGSDELIGLGWSESSESASRWFDEPGSWIAEGVAMPRALRKWLRRNTRGSPCEAALWLAHPVQHRTRGQHVMALGCASVWNEIRPELRKRGVVLLEADEGF